LGNWGIGEFGNWGIGELGIWGIGELGNWGLGELGNWGLGEFGKKNKTHRVMGWHGLAPPPDLERDIDDLEEQLEEQDPSGNGLASPGGPPNSPSCFEESETTKLLSNLSKACSIVRLGDLGTWGIGELGNWQIGELGNWGIGKLGTGGLVDLGNWGIGDLGTWGIRELGN
jgi:hypothetical protein